MSLIDKEITALGVSATIDFYKTMAIDALHLPGLSAFVTGADAFLLNIVVDTRKNATFSAELIQTMHHFFSPYQVPWGWLVVADVEQEDIKAFGFDLAFQSPGMYFDLNNALSEAQIEAICIQEENNDLKEWIKPLQEAFPNKDNCEVYRRLNADLLSKGEKKLRHFTAYCEHEAAVSGTLFFSNQAVAVHNMAARPQFRKRGIGMALLAHMMAEASRQGYRHCFLDASDAGLNLYNQVGFKTYCKTSFYKKV